MRMRMQMRMRMRHSLFCVLIATAFQGEIQAAETLRPGATCKCGCTLVERTIEVPTMVTERQTITVTECRTEMHERTVMVQKMIPEIKQVRDVFVEMVSHVETRVEKHQVCVPQWRTETQDVTVDVPTVEKRTGTRRVCRPVQVEELCTVAQDPGYWGDCFPYDGRYGMNWWRPWGYGPFGYRGWYHYSGYYPNYPWSTAAMCQPNCVTEQVPMLVWRNEIVEEPYEYSVTVYHPEVRRQDVKVYAPVFRDEEREVQVTVCKPRTREAIRNVSTFRAVSEPRVEQYKVQVPHTVEKEVDVQVCRMVAKTVWVCPSCR